MYEVVRASGRISRSWFVSGPLPFHKCFPPIFVHLISHFSVKHLNTNTGFYGQGTVINCGLKKEERLGSFIKGRQRCLHNSLANINAIVKIVFFTLAESFRKMILPFTIGRRGNFASSLLKWLVSTLISIRHRLLLHGADSCPFRRPY